MCGNVGETTLAGLPHRTERYVLVVVLRGSRGLSLKGRTLVGRVFVFGLRKVFFEKFDLENLKNRKNPLRRGSCKIIRAHCVEALCKSNVSPLRRGSIQKQYNSTNNKHLFRARILKLKSCVTTRTVVHDKW